MKPLADKRRSPDLPRRILFLNDVGFQYGAGVAQSRQLECILGLGIEAGVLTWAHGNIQLEDVATRVIDPDLWLGIREVNHLECGKTLADSAVVAGLLMEVARFQPEVVLVGNLHAARWPFQLLTALRDIGCRVITFLHDAYLFTGRCAYPGSCTLYLTGCNDTCPTASQYPALEPALIAGAWRTRRELFGGPNGIEIVANSQWNKKMFQTALPAVGHIETVELSANEEIFKPGDKHSARRELGLPDDRPIVLCAAVNFQEARKGGQQLRDIVAAIRTMVRDARFMLVAGPWVRVYATARFSMRAQEERWRHYLSGHVLTGTGLNPPTLDYPGNDLTDGEPEMLKRYRPSWPGADTFLTAEHAAIFERTSALPGWQAPGDSFKLYEMGYHAGDVILEIGTFGGRSATVALRGALANPARTRAPQFYGIDIFDDSITQTRQILAGEMLGQYCHLFHGVLAEFTQRWSITPTMVFFGGDQSYEGCKAGLEILARYLRAGTPILVHDYLNDENEGGKIGVRRAAKEWAAAGYGRLLGFHGCCALYVVQKLEN